jgi:hypothetical protein
VQRRNPLKSIAGSAASWLVSASDLQAASQKAANVTAVSVRPPAGGSSGFLAGRWRGLSWLTPVNVAIAATTLLALGLRLYQLAGPGFLLGVTEYDDGSYFGSAVHLVHGVLPYRDFVFVQPPGITLLMTPIALLSKAIGTAWGLAIGRILTTVVSAAGVLLVGLLVRHRGVTTTITACGLLAIYPDSVSTARTVLLEPWLVLFCLAGAVAVFDGDHLTGSRRRLVLGGLALGFAGAIEAWAIGPALVILGLSLPKLRRAVTCLAGIAVGFLVPVVPFAALAPASFFRDLIVAQAGPRAGSTRVPIWYRLKEMAGFSNVDAGHPIVLLAVLVIAGFAVGTLAAGWLITQRRPPALDWFALLTASLIAAAFLLPDVFYFHFVAFLAPFVAMAVALPLSRLIQATQPTADRAGAGAELRWWAGGLAALVIIVFGVSEVSAVNRLQNNFAAVARDRASIVAAAERVIPPGACVLTDQVSFTIAANRFVTSVPGCSPMDDGIGADLALSHGLKPNTGAGKVPAVEAMWHDAFQHAQYVLLSAHNYRRVAWTPALRAFFYDNFQLVTVVPDHDALYVRKGLRLR